MTIRTAIVAALAGSVLISIPAAQTARTAFTGMRLIDGTDAAPIDNATLLVENGRVVSAGSSARVTIPADAARVSLAGKTVIPGLINAHGHANNIEHDLRAYADYGVTTVFSLGNDNNSAEAVAVRDKQDAARLPRARLFTAGLIVTGETPAAARAQVAADAAMRVDLIKIRIEDDFGRAQKMSPEVYRAVIDEAHQRKLRVAAHMFYLDDAKGLLDAGVDLLAHSVRDREVDAALITKMKSRNVCLVPTLMRDVSTFVYESAPAFFDDPLFQRYSDKGEATRLRQPASQRAIRDNADTPKNKAALEMAKRNLKALVAGGATIAMGTDTGASANRFPGYFEMMELEMMAEVGLTPRQVLASATRDAARCMGHDHDLGTLTSGKWADLVVLDADPLVNVKNVRAIDAVYVAGVRVPR